jgi:hypothetical protein
VLNNIFQMSLFKPQCKKWNENGMIPAISVVRIEEVVFKTTAELHNVLR